MAKQIEKDISLDQIREMKAAAYIAFKQQNSAPYVRFEDMVKKETPEKEN